MIYKKIKMQEFKEKFLGMLERIFNTPFLKSQKGYLVIELLVAMTLFSVIVVIAIGSFVNVLKTQRQVAALSAAESNLNVVFEQMTREIRTGYSFTQSSIGDGLTFTNAEGKTITYALGDGDDVLKKTVDGKTLAVTGDNVVVEYFKVYFRGNVVGDTWNPRVTISVGIHSKDASLRENVLNLQTTISARKADCTSGDLPQC